ncbi:MAG: hypothetical protein ABIJ96_05710 [Elusimicrobiota bacterium]
MKKRLLAPLAFLAAAAFLLLRAPAYSAEQPALVESYHGIQQSFTAGAPLGSRSAGMAAESKVQFQKASSDSIIAELRGKRNFDPDKASDDEILSALQGFGHVLQRHSPDVSDDYLRGRGIRVATKFDTYPNMYRTSREVWRAVEKKVSSDQRFSGEVAKMLAGKLQGISLQFFMPDGVGYGLKKTSSGYERVNGIKEVTVVVRSKSGKVGIYTMYPQGR